VVDRLALAGAGRGAPVKRLARAVGALALLAALAVAAADDLAFAERELAAHAGQSGAYVLERGDEALIARAWLADHARESIDVQYFIWSTDNIGILAAEALLRAADRGVQVRVIVDDLLVDAPDRALLALAAHPRIDIRIYNPKVSAGVSWPQRLRNLVTEFRAVNQRMHDKTFIVDGRYAITGGRNMAVEYFDYHHAFNFRDRDALVAGPVAATMRRSFEEFWRSELSRPVESIYPAAPPMPEGEADALYRELHVYAADPANFAPEVRAAIARVPHGFAALAGQTAWGDVRFLSDRPGKNAGGFDGGGRTSTALGELLASARETVVIQSPYLVASDRALAIFRDLRARGVRIRVSTNSLASTDNLQAFSGYRSQRAGLLALGLEVFEARPDAAIRQELMKRAGPAPTPPPIFSVHAKTLVVDGVTVYIGTFNLDPRSENLNTEVGVVLRDARVAGAVLAAIESDMAPANSWSALEDPDRHASLAKRAQVRCWQLLPLRPLL
jgi:cardiolipin synthase C